MKEKILIIDDTKNIRLLASKALSSEGYEVDSAESGTEGLQLAENCKYDLVFVDIRMPNLSGTEVLKKLKAIDEELPVIIITAFPTVKNAVDCIKLGALDYLRKPFTADKLKQVVKEVFSQRTQQTEYGDNYEAVLDCGRSCLDKGNLQEGIKQFKKAVSLRVDDSEPFKLLGKAYDMLGEREMSAKYLKIAHQLETDTNK